MLSFTKQSVIGDVDGVDVVRAPRSPLIPDYVHLEGHYPDYSMVTCQRKEIKTIHLYFHAFYNQNMKFFT